MVDPHLLGGSGRLASTLSRPAPRNDYDAPEKPSGHVNRRARGAQQPYQGKSKSPCIWGAGRGQQQYLTIVQANPDTCSSATRLEELDSLFWDSSRAHVVGLQEVRRPWDNRVGTTCADGHYTLFHTASDGPNLGVGMLIRTPLLPSIMYIKLMLSLIHI